MFKYKEAFSGFSVPDIAATKQFYGTALGLKIDEHPEGLEIHLKDDVSVFVYPAQHKAADYTELNFVVDDIEKAVGDLVQRGVSMEQYDLPGIKTDEKGICWGVWAMGWDRRQSRGLKTRPGTSSASSRKNSGRIHTHYYI